MNNNPDWEQLTKNISSIINVPERIINLVSVIDILRLSVSGCSNKEIAEYYKLDNPNLIKDEIQSFMEGFDGWEETLTINPLMIYKTMLESGYDSKLQFTIEIVFQAPNYNVEVITKMFNSVTQFYRLVEEMEKSWK